MLRKIDAKILLAVIMGVAFLGGGAIKLLAFTEQNASPVWLYGGIALLAFGVGTFVWMKWRSDRSLKASIERSRRGRGAGRQP